MPAGFSGPPRRVCEWLRCPLPGDYASGPRTEPTYSLVQCDKVAIVHTNKSNENLEIIIITSIRYKNKKLKLISKDFINKNKEVADEYIRIKKIRNDAAYYFQVINCGELNKYILLDNIYKNCVNAIYTSSAIESIKIARGQKEI